MSSFDIFLQPFDAQNTEPKLREYWQKNNFYHSKPNPQKKPYTIVMPPPNVTGDLTMGHMMYVLQDILIRWHRAAGFEACWIPGTDHASIATEAKVTKMLSEKGISKEKIGREKFLEHAYEWKQTYGNRIVESLKTLGISCDWQRLVFTMDEKYSAAVIKAIVQLYKDGLIYKSHRLVNWCPVSQSVISDEEVNSEERSGHLWHIRYPMKENPQECIVVATTRPETLFGDMAIAVSPNDTRYANAIGKTVIVPLCGREIPVVADHYVEPEFGTGAVKITPAHDMNDFEVGKRHKLELLNIMNPDATLNDKVPQAYRGLDRFVARKKLVQELKEIGLLEKVTDYKVTLGISERGNVPIEYYLSEQWYIKMDKLAELTLDATKSGRLKLIPAFQEKVWQHWLNNIQDWCISRQLWWGHRLPMYTCANCKHIHCEEAPPKKCEKCGHEQLNQDEDVLDTWASSWLWPFGVHNWAHPTEQEKQDLDYYYPTDVIITGADIIFFWIARMVMAGEYFTGKTPFKACYFTPIIRDAHGRKMSKSLGNSPDVQEIMKTYGVDAMRFSLVNQIAPGQDIFWKDSCCDLGKTFVNKLWNVARFLTMNMEKLAVTKSSGIRFEHFQKPDENDVLSRWICSEFFDAVEKSHQSISKFEFSHYTSKMYEFSWMIYCDWFVELAKPRFAEANHSAAALLTLALQLFDGVLRLLHPVIPFVTEEIWQHIFSCDQSATIGFAALPSMRKELRDESVILKMRDVQNVVSQVRTIRGKFNVHPGQELVVFSKGCKDHFGDLFAQMETLSKAKFLSKEKEGFCAAALVNGLEIFVSLKGLVDPNAERERLNKKIEKITSAIAGIEKRLSNQEFVQSAPPHIVQGAQQQLADNTKELDLLKEMLLHF